MSHPHELYHGSSNRIEGALTPILQHTTDDHVHTRSSLFATERKDLATLFMISPKALCSIGFEHDIAYMCLWGTSETSASQDQAGFLYTLPTITFEKIGKGYEWQSFESVVPSHVTEYPSALDGMMACGVQLYFIDDDATFDRTVEEKDNRAPLLRNRLSENQKMGKNVRLF